jgi:hypothetical protein
MRVTFRILTGEPNSWASPFSNFPTMAVTDDALGGSAGDDLFRAMGSGISTCGTHAQAPALMEEVAVLR